ncbi:alpha/beta hydrolase family protein [Psychrobacter sp. I-STPA6b]|uniref:alpha/beta hydrolase family protein n=1 Tax=Psychrobacter sp. I-STPA6b TaxID=2585718 RepID=UPI001D0C87FB|nr:alpha/beta hydrolase [Psychrobacter sp. I-STPA6b]
MINALPTINKSLLLSVFATSLLLTACGDDNNDTNTHIESETPKPTVKLLNDPEVTQTFTATQLAEAIKQAKLSAAVPISPICGVTVEYINHSTTGLKGEETNATGAVMIPTGDDPQCQGERPVSLYAHGTAIEKNYNLAALNDQKNPAYKTALLVAATMAGQGDIVIAPNYPGYDKSNLDYTPYITRKQGKQMVDSLLAGKAAVQLSADAGNTSVSAGDKLFVSGYSQGGYVALATSQALDEAGIPVTAISPGSGPYAMAAFGDAIVLGNTIVAGTVFLPMLFDSYTAEYGDDVTKGIYAGSYAQTAPSLLPSTETIEAIFAQGKLPMVELFAKAPTGVAELDPISPKDERFAWGFGDNYLISTPYRAKYVADIIANPDGLVPEPTKLPFAALAPQHSLRAAFKANDLRTYAPKAPTLLCGAHQDPSVFFDVNSTAMAGIWKETTNIPFALIDLDLSNQEERAKEQTPKLPYLSTLPTIINTPVEATAKVLQKGFGEQMANIKTKAYQDTLASLETAIANGAMTQAIAETKATQAATIAFVSKYHSTAMPYCLNASQAFFAQYR